MRSSDAEVGGTTGAAVEDGAELMTEVDTGGLPDVLLEGSWYEW